jgi:hypothetical protein
MTRKLTGFLSLAIWSMNGICQSSPTREGNKAGDAALLSSDKSKIELHIHADDHSPKAFVVFSNASKATLWLPIQPTPSYRPDEKMHLLTIWFGYFDEVDGSHKGHYMLPAMHPVQPGEKFKFELTSHAIVQELLKTGMKTKIQVRVATKAFPHSRIRNDQPVEDYIHNSLVVDSVSSARK